MIAVRAALAVAVFVVAVCVALPARARAAEARPFVHPGILHTAQDLDRIREAVAAHKEPWQSGYDVFRRSPFAIAEYKVHGPYEKIGRGENSNFHKKEADEDSLAAYQNAVMWAITKDPKHAEVALAILRGYAGRLKEVAGRDAQLGAGFWGFNFANAAELLRYTYPGWTDEDTANVTRMLRDAFLPVIRDFATFANGNWDGACMKAMLAIAVFTDDHELFERGIDYYKNGKGDGRLTHYIINEAGQCQESGRDQQHTQLGLSLLAECCQVAWSQHVDLFSLDDNRLMKGFEYTAKYNLGEDVPFEETTDTTGKYHHVKISPEGRGRFRAVWELAYAHYHAVEHLPMPWTEKVLEKIRPEGAPFTADNAGFGTLLFYRAPAASE